MVEKRLKKLELLENDAVPPELLGSEDYKNLVVCWGSTFEIVSEACRNLNRNDVAMLHFKQVYPLPGETTDYLQKAKRIIIVEGNATCQFGKLIRLRTGIDIQDKILKYNGLSFYAEEVTEKLNRLLS